MNSHITEAINVVKRGGIIIFPTDTAFGIGCRIDNTDSINRLFRLRKRSSEKAFTVLATSIKMVEEYVGPIPPDVRDLMNKYWPGGLTIVMNASEKMNKNVIGDGESVGVRIPGNSTVRKIISGVGVPIAGPSANFAGEKTPFYFSEIDPELLNLVDYVVPGRCELKKSSTVIDVTNKPWKVLRKGAVSI